MSTAGARSGRGDVYQRVVAFEWVIEMLRDPNILWLEFDSTATLPNGLAMPVDDVVIRYGDGHIVACQAKKNDPNFTFWDVKTLSSDLSKAADLLAADSQAELRFYSYANFADLRKLQEYASTHSDEAGFEASLGANLKASRDGLAKLWKTQMQVSSATLWSFLCRIDFRLTGHTTDYMNFLARSLATTVTQPEAAFNSLWHIVDLLGAHLPAGGAIASNHRVTRDELFKVLEDCGSAVRGDNDTESARAAFEQLSAVGRSWRRDVGGTRLVRAATRQLLDAIEAKQRTVLLTDGPGAGKTCILLDVVGELERDSNRTTLFIQAREFAEAANDTARAELGIPAHLTRLVSTAAEAKHTVVVIDSLDVLSLSREGKSLTYFLSLVDRLARIPNTTVVVACRSFDLKYDRRLDGRTWDARVEAGALDWDNDIVPTLTRVRADINSLDATTRALLSNARNLALFVDLAARNAGRSVASAQELAEAYLQTLVANADGLGSTAMQAIEEMAQSMLLRRISDVPPNQVRLDQRALARLLSEAVLFQTTRGNIGFGHQSLLDALVVSGAERSNQSLLQLIQSLPAVPFVRPTIRAFFLHLRSGDPRRFRSSVRAVFASDTAFHLKRLLAESLASSAPSDDDWQLLEYLKRDQPVLFDAVYSSSAMSTWHGFWERHWLASAIEAQDQHAVRRHASRLAEMYSDNPTEVLAAWTRLLDLPWMQSEDLVNVISGPLARQRTFPMPQALEFFRRLAALPRPKYENLGDALAALVTATDVGDDLLWEYVTTGCDDGTGSRTHLEANLRCGTDHIRDAAFLLRRMVDSVAFLDMAITAIETWSEARRLRYAGQGATDDGFLKKTTWNDTHSKHQTRHQTALDVLIRTVEAAVARHAKAHDEWWNSNARRLAFSNDSGLRYVAMQAITADAEYELNRSLADELLRDERTLTRTDVYELCQLIAAHANTVAPATLDFLATTVIANRKEMRTELGHRTERDCLLLLSGIPASIRPANADAVYTELSARLPAATVTPDIFSRSGTVPPPFTNQQLTALSNEGLLDLLLEATNWNPHFIGPDGFMGNFGQVEIQLRFAASREPTRFLELMSTAWDVLPSSTLTAMFEGAIDYLRYLHGNVQPQPGWKTIEDSPGIDVARRVLDELDHHDLIWYRSNAGASALCACAYVEGNDNDLQRLLFLAAGYTLATEPNDFDESVGDIRDQALVSTRGMVTEGLMQVASSLAENDIELPGLLRSTLWQFANGANPTVKCAVLNSLAMLLYKDSPFGWELLEASLTPEHHNLWHCAEHALYAAIDSNFARVRPFLDCMRMAVMDSFDGWARLMTLGCLAGGIGVNEVIEEVATLDSSGAWSGNVSVWLSNINTPEHRQRCIDGLSAAIAHTAGAVALRQQGMRLFAKDPAIRPVPIRILECIFTEPLPASGPYYPPGTAEWLCSLVPVDPDQALQISRLVASAAKAGHFQIFDGKPVSQLLTLLLREAEDREESDNGLMLTEVIAVQDDFLNASVPELLGWLRAAERPDE